MKSRRLLPILYLYLTITGCVQGEDSCTDHIASQSIDLENHESEQSTSSPELSAMIPFELDRDWSDSDILLTGTDYSELRERFPYSPSDSTYENYDSLFLDLLPNRMWAKNEAGDIVFETTVSEPLEFIGWSFASSAFAYRKAGALQIVDLRDSAPEALSFDESRIQFLPTGGALLQSYFGYEGRILDDHFETLHEFKTDTLYDEDGPKGYLKFDGETYLLPTAVEPIGNCFDSERELLIIHERFEFDLHTHEVRETEFDCENIGYFSSEDPSGMFSVEQNERLENWELEFNFEIIENTLEHKTYDWKCPEKDFSVGKLSFEYSLKLTSGEEHEILQSGSFEIIYKEPSCNSYSYS